MPVRPPKAGGGPGCTGTTPDTSAKPTVLAVLPRAAWADSLLEATCNGQCDLVRAVRPAEARQLAARVPPDVVLWGCLTLSDEGGEPDSPALTELRSIKVLYPAAEILAVVHDHGQVRLSTYCELILTGVRCLVDADQSDAAEVAEERTLGQSLGDGAAVDDDERAVLALLVQAMNGVREQRLACTGLTGDEDRHVTQGGGSVHEGEDPGVDEALTHQADVVEQRAAA